MGCGRGVERRNGGWLTGTGVRVGRFVLSFAFRLVWILALPKPQEGYTDPEPAGASRVIPRRPVGDQLGGVRARTTEAGGWPPGLEPSSVAHTRLGL